MSSSNIHVHIGLYLGPIVGVYPIHEHIGCPIVSEIIPTFVVLASTKNLEPFALQ